MNYVIIGNSSAAIGCIEGIRSIDAKGTITVLTNENHHTYSRPLISYLLQGKTDEKHMMYRSADFYKKNKVTLVKGAEVTKIDASSKVVTYTLDDETKTISYDALMYGTGSRPFVPPADGLDSIKKYFTFMTLDSAKELGKALNKKSRVLIIGAGLIGMKCAEGIAERSGSITIVEMAPRCLPAVLDEKGSSIVQKQMEKHGVKFMLGDSVKTFVGNSTEAAPYGGKAILNSGKEIDFDVLVMAVGVRPNTQIAQEAGAEVNRGIIINEKCETSIKGIYAAGDCTESDDITAGMRRILALLPNAYMQGEVAGITMAGGKKSYLNAMPINAAGFFGLHLVTAGTYAGTSHCKTSGDKNTYRMFFTDNDLLKGFIIIGDTERSGIYTTLIRKQVPLSSIDFDLIMEHPQLMAFSSTDRADMLAKEPVPVAHPAQELSVD